MLNKMTTRYHGPSWLLKVALTCAGVILGLITILAVMMAQASAQDAGGTTELPTAPPDSPTVSSDPLVNVAALEPDPWAEPCPSPTIDQKVLVLATDGGEANLPAIEQALATLGTPYTIFKTADKDLSATDLKNGCNAFYSGVILTNGELAYSHSDGSWGSAFDPSEWDTLANYEKMFGIRQVTWYTFPEPKWGFNFANNSFMTTDDSPYAARFTGTSSPFSSYVNTANQLKIANAFTYLAQPLTDPSVMSSNQVSSVTPLLTDASGNALAALTKYDDGRQNLALTFDSNQYLTHAQVLSYGLINWVTKGMFLGERHVYMDPQPDDIFGTSDTWNATTPCGTNLDTTPWPYGQYRMTASDLNSLITWQKAKRTQPTTAQLTIEMPFNGAYATNDALRTAAQNNQGQFKWLNHTWTHHSWNDADDNGLNGIQFPGLTYSEAKSEVAQNNTLAKNLGFAKYKATNLVTPEISGLGRKGVTFTDGSTGDIPPNADALQAAYDTGVRYTAGDASRAGIDQPVTAFNEGWYTTASGAGYTPPTGSQPYSILVYPRHATNLFFNVSTPEQWVAEYNCIYSGFWGRNLSYNEILGKESDMLLSYLLKGDVDPLMFHQANLRAYANGKSLMGDLLDATFTKYNALYKLPILSPTVDGIGQKMAERMAYNSAEVTASVGPDQNGVQSITLTAQKAAKVPVTGLGPRTASSPVAYTTESYGGQSISYVSLSAGQSVTIPLQ